MKNLISVQSLSYSVPYGPVILEKVDLEVPPGLFLGILGHNGTGKTTFLDILMGHKKGTGEIRVLDEDPHSVSRSQKEKIVFLSQDVSLKGNLTIGEFLKFHSAFYLDYNKEEEAQLLRLFELKKEMKIGALSTGQQKKVQIVAGLSSKPKLIIIDEITAVLDPETRDIFFAQLKRMQEQFSTAIVLATNIAEDLVGRADQIFFIENRKGVLHSPEEILHLFNIGKAA